MNENFSQSAIRAALVFGAIGAAALLARRIRAPGGAPHAVPPLDAPDFGPIRVDPIDLQLPTVTGIAATRPATVVERITTFLGDAVDKVKAALLPRGIRNNNPGNIRWISQAGRRWRGMERDDGGGYAVFDTMANGVRALGKQLLKYQERGLDTVREIIATWAPSSENDTGAYVGAVAAALQVSPDEKISVQARLADLAAAIIRHENGAPFEAYREPGRAENYTRAELARWVQLP